MMFFILNAEKYTAKFCIEIFNANIYPLLTHFLFLLIKEYVKIKKDDENENN